MMTLTRSNIFKRFSKRRRMRALAVALIDRVEYGQPTRLGRVVHASAPGVCRACSVVYDVDTEIELARLGPYDAPTEQWIHRVCPSWWDIMSGLAEKYDELIIVQVATAGRRTASCGHACDNELIYLVRKPVSLRANDHSKWVCERCATR